jgi:hypothetical protein
MKKIPTMFERNPVNMSEVLMAKNPEATWLFDPSVPRIATVKKDGTNVLVVSEELEGGGYAYGLKKRKNPSRKEKKAAEAAGRPAPEPTYVFASSDDPQDKHIYRAFESHFLNYGLPFDGAGEWPAEALGFKIQGGVEGDEYRLYFFTVEPQIIADPMSPEQTTQEAYQSIEYALALREIEGIVWQATDGSGRMAKIKRRDFGLPWPTRKEDGSVVELETRVLPQGVGHAGARRR